MSVSLASARPFRGSVDAEGIVLDRTWLTEPTVQARVLGLRALHPDARVYSVDGALVVLASMRVDTRAALGTPLVRQGAFLASVQLTAREQRALRAHAIDTCWVRGGTAEALALSSANAIDVGDWLELSDWRLEEGVRSLGASPPPPSDAQPAVDPDVRKALNMPPASKQASALAAALHQGGAGKGVAALGSVLGALAAITTVAAVLAGRFVVPLIASLGALFGGGGSGGAGSRAGSSSGARGPARGAEGEGRGVLGWLSRMERALRNWIARSRLGAFIGQQHARYLQQMLEMFDEGRLEEALRHAIPLGSEGTGPAQAALGALRPRSDLSIELDRGGPGTSLFGGFDLYAHLRRRYRAAFETLVQRGEIDKAAFVLVELLGASEEAVSFLERHGRLQLAAELAEAKDLPPGLQIRQWFLARDVPRALAIARRTGAFADAVLRLSRDQAAAAEALRILWAESLAEAGSYSAAIDVLWPLARCRPLAMQWIERGIAIGGVAGARMLARKASQLPDSVADVHLALEALLSSETNEREAAASMLIAFADHLVVPDGDTPIARLARAVWRRAMQLGSASASALSHEQAEQLAAASRLLLIKAHDPLLAHDAEPLARGEAAGVLALASRAPAAQLRWHTDDRGALIANDALELPDGRLLLALGELGAILLRADGSVQARFAQPADALVGSHRGDRAILVARRGQATRLARVDLSSRRCEPWCDAALTAWAPTFDGETWYAANEGTLFGIDATDAGWSHRFRVTHDDDEAHIRGVQCDEDNLAVLFNDVWKAHHEQERGSSLWSYALPSQALRRRRPQEQPGRECGAFAASGAVLEYTTPEDGPSVLIMDSARSELAPDEHVLEVSERWAITLRLGQPAVVVVVRDAHSLTVRLEAHLEGAREGRVRLQGERLVVMDDLGRVLVLSLSTGAVLRDLRPSG